MSDERDPLAAFDADVIESVAADRDCSLDELRGAVERHQESIRDLPGVEDIVYEWRSQFHRDPLVARTDAVYYLSLPGHVWDEFADALAFDEQLREAVVTVHRRQLERALGSDGEPVEGVRDDELPVVLTRP